MNKIIVYTFDIYKLNWFFRKVFNGKIPDVYFKYLSSFYVAHENEDLSSATELICFLSNKLHEIDTEKQSIFLSLYTEFYNSDSYEPSNELFLKNELGLLDIETKAFSNLNINDNIDDVISYLLADHENCSVIYFSLNNKAKKYFYEG